MAGACHQDSTPRLIREAVVVAVAAAGGQVSVEEAFSYLVGTGNMFLKLAIS